MYVSASAELDVPPRSIDLVNQVASERAAKVMVWLFSRVTAVEAAESVPAPRALLAVTAKTYPVL